MNDSEKTEGAVVVLPTEEYSVLVHDSTILEILMKASMKGPFYLDAILEIIGCKPEDK